MQRLPDLSVRPRPRNETLRVARSAGLVAAVVLALAGCKGDESMAAAALVASAPAMPTANVPPPPLRQQPAGTTAAAPADLAAVRAQLESTLANASTCSVDTDCHTVAVGAKACGGPTAFRAFSGKDTDTARVALLAQHERDLAAAAARASHEVSPCFMLADPGARCETHKCVTGRPGAP
jgi:hypothetical protein